MAVTDEMSILRGPYSFPDGIYGALVTPADASVRTQTLNLLDLMIPTANAKQRVLAKHAKVGSVVDETAPLYIAEVAGVLQYVSVFIHTAMTGDATLSIDIKKGGVSVLTTPLVLTSASAALTRIPASILTTTIAANAVLEVIVDETHTSGTPAVGLCVQAAIHENAY